MKLLLRLTFIFSFLLFSGCASYVNRLHQDFDKNLRKTKAVRKNRDNFSMYRNKTKRPMNHFSTSSRRSLIPNIKRHYVPKNYKKRYKADDLNDNQDDGSLWSEKRGKNNFLFTQNATKQNGDIILVQVFGKLKNEITAELKRVYPATQKKNTPKKEDSKTTSPVTPATPARDTAATNNSGADESKVYDRISSVIIEEINGDHLLLRGRKSLIYKNSKRLIEVQALVSRKDILDNDTVESNKILESSVTVIR